METIGRTPPRLACLCLLMAVVAPSFAATDATPASCRKPIYLTFDTGHMEVAPLIAEVLARHQVKVTFFAANETTKVGDGSLGTHWAPWWRAWLPGPRSSPS